MDTSLYKRFVELNHEIAEAKTRLADLQERKRQMTDSILAEFAEEGIDQMRVEVDGEPFTVYPNEILRAKAANGDHDRLNLLLEKYGFGDIIRRSVNSQTLSAFVRERLQEEPLPEDLRAALDVTLDCDVRVRRSTRRQSASSAAKKNL